MIVLDTDLLSGLHRNADGPLHRWLAAQTEPPCLAACSITEVQYGIAVLRLRNAAAAVALTAWLDQILASSEVLAFGAAAARLLGEMRAVTHLRSLEGDLMIAATAIVAGFPIATLNLRDFRLIARHFPALVVVDPLGSR